jgi:glutamyl-tRNA reductase
MQLFALGINHHNAPLSVREKVVFDSGRLPQALCALLERGRVREAAIISTCNRTEIYCTPIEGAALSGNTCPQSAAQWLADYHRLSPQVLEPYLYVHSRADAVRHLFRLACGLDSMVLGETQILGQMKQAVRIAEEAGTVSVLLGKLFQKSFSVAKDVRTATAIGTNIVSIASAAMHLCTRIFERIGDQKILLIGAGEMIELCATHFATENPRCITIANRTTARAQALAQRFSGDAIDLSQLGEHLGSYDIIVSCTASPVPVIELGMVERALKQRRHRPQVIVDLAVPRDTDSQIARLDDVFLYTLDDLAHIVATGKDTRQAAVVEAQAIVDAHVREFLHWVESRRAVPTIRALRDMAERHRRHELDHALKMLSRGDSPHQVLEALSHGLTNKLMHSPTQALNLASADHREALADLVTKLYHLHPELTVP